VFPEAGFRGAGFLDEEIRGQVSGGRFIKVKFPIWVSIGVYAGRFQGWFPYRGFRSRFSATGFPGADFPSEVSDGRLSEGSFTWAVLRGFGFPGGDFTVADFAGFEVSGFRGDEVFQEGKVVGGTHKAGNHD
jgi:hypothetical protein